MKFYVGEKVKATTGKYAGQSVIIEGWAGANTPTLYLCPCLNGLEIALHENELESLYEHDMRMLREYKK